MANNQALPAERSPEVNAQCSDPTGNPSNATSGQLVPEAPALAPVLPAGECLMGMRIHIGYHSCFLVSCLVWCF